MAEIQEIPLDAVEAPEATPEMVAEQVDTAEIAAPAPKKRGRPPGVKNKTKEPPAPKAKPKAKRKAYVPPSPAESSSGEDTPPPRARRPARHTPEPLDRRALAADVLGLLQEQRMSRGVARRTHYATWFQNM